MEHKRNYEEGFLLVLLFLAIIGLLYLFNPFLEALFFAMILATASYRYFERFQKHFKCQSTIAAMAMSSIVLVGVIAPVTYLLVELSVQAGQLFGVAQSWLSNQNANSLSQLHQSVVDFLPVGIETEAQLLQQLQQHSEKIVAALQKTILFLLNGIVGSTTSFISFLILSVFALFFFYRDGHAIANHLKILSPLQNQYDQILMDRFASLSSVLTLSVLSIALMQGVAFAIIAWILGLPGLFIGMAVAIASFIPIVGAALIWVPIAIYGAVIGDWWLFGIMTFWGVVVTGFLIDNLARPLIINRLTQMLDGDETTSNVANHTLITVLSTFAGIIHFGVIGLFFGPVIAAMAITVFEVYEKMHTDRLDQS